MIDARKGVLWVGDTTPTDVADAIAKRGLLTDQLTAVTSADLNKACATVFFAAGASAAPIVGALKAHAKECLDHGHRVLICCQNDVWKTINGIPEIVHCLHRELTADCDDLAELIRGGLQLAGPPATGPEQAAALALGDEDQTLLRRAFWDCDIATLKELKEGRSAARVFRVHARRQNQEPPGYLLPFLVKIDDRPEIEREVTNYERFVDGHIPFTQRPNLNDERTVYGPTRAVMVSDFVDEAYPLTEVCRRPESRTVLYSLFDDALRSWRRDAFIDGTTPQKLPISDYLEPIVKPAEILPAVIGQAQKFGLKANAEGLLARVRVVSVHPYRIGTIHGDLHPGNVMVRRQEAILIDFASIWENRPIIADLACLEVAACFTIAPEGTTRNPSRLNRSAFAQWRNELKKLFACTCLRQVPPLKEPGPFDWLWTLCRQTRSMAAQAEASKSAYACALAIYLLRRARLSRADEHPAIGALALRTAERMIADLEGNRI